MTEMTKQVGAAVGLVALPAVVATKLVVKALQGPDVFDPAMPPPCWVPVQLPDRHAIVKSGKTATLSIGITNLGPEPQSYDVETNTPSVVIDTPVLVLGPLERGHVVLELAIPAATPHSALPPVVVTVNGCKSYRFRWLLKAKRWHVHHHAHQHHAHHHGHHAPLHHHPLAHHPAAALLLSCGCWHHVDIHDQPDFQHHWYDHFYSECGCDHA
ncbi:MAG: hypothetical protein JHD16_10445 [Solirubrobacteraceae bacterium]|nr:hypothetical protein [Solirubrobacteraceae bacterium]